MDELLNAEFKEAFDEFDKVKDIYQYLYSLNMIDDSCEFSIHLGV